MYDHKRIDKKWQECWETAGVFRARDDAVNEKFYCLIEFPYPSGAGLHVGHPRSYVALDIIARQKRMKGKNVLYPIGWDAFGLPTENYAIKTGRPPQAVTAENIAVFRRQIKSLGLSFDWSREINTTDPNYYKWTQWMFLQFFKNGLAYKKKMPINWCPTCKIGLANEEAVGGACERCGGAVEKRDKEQWMIGITKYADRLLADLDTVNYLLKIKKQQQEWIGRSAGAEVDFAVVGGVDKIGDATKIRVFTTRPDTLFGATYIVLAPENELVEKITTSTQSSEIKKYIAAARAKTEIERANNEKEKTGVWTGALAVNPVNNEHIPIWVADYVMMGYVTGAIMAVPAHDERDFAFARQYDLPIRKVVAGGDIATAAFIGNGTAINSGFLNGLDTASAKHKMISWLAENNFGKRATNYKLRDWVFSRQRYWGEPIPLAYCEKCAQKKQKVLLIHGFEANADSNWFPWIKKELTARGFTVFAPTMSTGAHPDLEKWMAELKPFIEQLGEDDIIIGHSLGSKAALHLVERANKKIGSLILVASAIGEVTERDWDKFRVEWSGSDIDALRKFWQAQFSWDKVNELVARKTLILSDDDPFIKTSTHENLPVGWFLQRTSGYGHYQEIVEPTILTEILNHKLTGWRALPESDLPLTLPLVKNYQPTDSGESPLAAMADWVNTKCPRCGGAARRETDTMPNWAGSSWYFLRYVDAHNDNAFATPEKLKYWMPVDLYNGGMEHTTLHLLYSRFWNKFLYDCGYVPTSEPYARRVSHGLILAADGSKMSKSKGNVVNPDEIIEKYGADTLRLYEMFIGSFSEPAPWNVNGVSGVRRFLDRAARLAEIISADEPEAVTRALHKTIKKVSGDIERMSFNTAVAAFMEFINVVYDAKKITAASLKTFVILLNPFAPHLGEELWETLNGKNSLACVQPWPVFDAVWARDENYELVIQVNGKIRDRVEINADAAEEEMKMAALSSDKVIKFLNGVTPKQVIAVKGKLINIVV